MRRLSKWVIRTVVILLALAVISLLFPPTRRALWTTLFLADFVAGDSPSLFKRLTPDPVVTSDSLTVDDSLRVSFDLYRAPADKPTAALLFTHGFAHRGNRDPRVQAQARRLARAGFAVMTPDLQQMKTYRLGFQDVDAVVACLQFLRQLPGIDSTRIGVVAPSFGAGPVLIATSRPEVRDHVHFGLIFGGYYDLRRTLFYTLTGAYDAEGQVGRMNHSANRHNRWKFLRGNLHLLPPSPSRGAYTDFLTAKIDDPDLDIRPVLDRFSSAEQRLLAFMDNEDPARFDSLFASVPPSFHAWIDTLSLHYYAPDIRTRLLIVHSDADDKVHYTESLALGQALANAPLPTVIIVSVFAHVDLSLEWRSFQMLRQKVLPGLGQLWSLGHHLLEFGN